jgi:DNA-binding NarL/FixJ family response regulator
VFPGRSEIEFDSGLCTSQTFRVVGTPRCGIPVRQDGTNVIKAPFFRRLTLRSATGTAQRAVPTLIVCEVHNPNLIDMAITISVVEDDRKTRSNLMALLNGENRLRLLTAYGSGEEAVRGIPVEKPQVALVDINLPGMSGIACTTALKLRLPELQVLMLTAFEDSGLIFDSLRAGASGYLLKRMVPTELIRAIEQVHLGGAPMSMCVARKVVDHFHQIRQPVSEVEKLSKREQEVITLLAKGYLYRQISDSLGISLGSVRTYLQRIYEKLHVQTRTEATVKFLRRD